MSLFLKKWRWNLELFQGYYIFGAFDKNNINMSFVK